MFDTQLPVVRETNVAVPVSKKFCGLVRLAVWTGCVPHVGTLARNVFSGTDIDRATLPVKSVDRNGFRKPYDEKKKRTQ